MHFSYTPSKRPALWLSLCFIICLAVSGCGGSQADPLKAFQRGDYTTALSQWRERADAGDAVAQNFLGVHYHLGLGVASDHREAAQWYTKAAENGNPDAQRNLGTMYYSGLGVPRDNGWAYGWYYVAAKNGNQKAEDARQSMMDEMTPNHCRLSEKRMREHLITKGILKQVMSNGQLDE